MPISLHDFNEKFVVMSTGLPAFGRACSTVGFTWGNQKNLWKTGQKSGLKFFHVFRPFPEKIPLLSKP
jgi:hypothetical protein